MYHKKTFYLHVLAALYVETHHLSYDNPTRSGPDGPSGMDVLFCFSSQLRNEKRNLPSWD